jgi:ribosome recycling factor
MLEQIPSLLAKTEEHLHSEFSKLQVGRANPAIVEDVFVNAYGARQPLRNLGNVGTIDAQTISIQPWDKSLLKEIEKGIQEANLGLNPINNGESLLIKVPSPTEERRRELAKVAKKLAEEAKIAVRNVRQDGLKKIHQAKSDKTLSEDAVKQKESELQKLIDVSIKKIDETAIQKEKDIMKV